jgi:hypothetical protein
MLKSNSAREIFYIFLWLGGIIFLYALVEMYILEPSHYNNNKTAHAEQSSAQHSTTTLQSKKPLTTKHETPLTHSNIPKIVDVPKAITPVVATKAIHKVEKIVNSDKAVATKTKTVNETKQITHFEDSKQKKKISIQTPEHTSKNTKKATNTPIKNVQKEARSPLQVPTTPSTVSDVVSIPSTPSVPSMPTMPKSTTAIQTKTTSVPKEETQEPKTVPAIEELEKALSQDEEMQLIETARQHVIEEAEAAREAVMQALER